MYLIQFLSMKYFCSHDIMPLNITAASDAYGHYNLMPVYGSSFEEAHFIKLLFLNLSFMYFLLRSERL